MMGERGLDVQSRSVTHDSIDRHAEFLGEGARKRAPAEV